MEDQSVQETPDKTKKRFEEILKSLEDILGPGKLGVVSKVQRSELGGIVAELLKEENEANKAAIKERLKGILKGYSTMQSEIKAKRQELNKFEVDKTKEFIKSAEALFALIQMHKEKEATHTEGLKVAISGELPIPPNP